MLVVSGSDSSYRFNGGFEELFDPLIRLISVRMSDRLYAQIKDLVATPVTIPLHRIVSLLHLYVVGFEQ